MTRFERFDKQLAKRGWRYEVDDEFFYDGERIIDSEELLPLLPDMSLDELVSYQDDRWDRSSQRRRFVQAVAKKLAG
jgi:hypothetical protein